jgi:hypothetical protein
MHPVHSLALNWTRSVFRNLDAMVYGMYDQTPEKNRADYEHHEPEQDALNSGSHRAVSFGKEVADAYTGTCADATYRIIP